MGEAAARRSRECQRGRCPPQISHSRDQPGGPERKKNSSAPALGSQLSPYLLSCYDNPNFGQKSPVNGKDCHEKRS
ncbi:MAG: hypothetical protein J7M32_10825 [Deltaproteobacteria bacterium]|nr:hypothetical protein [Deltaproteobacteria bacterium]